MSFDPCILLECLEADLRVADKSNLYRNHEVADVASFRMQALKASILKKFVPGCREGELHTAALESFLDLNREVSNFKINESFSSSALVQAWRDELFSAFHTELYQNTSFTLSNFIQYGQCGPGNSLLCDDTSFYTKMFESPLATTKRSLLTLYANTINTRWAAAEEIRASAFSNVIVQGSTLSSVPKDKDKNRTICTEPPLNMFYQLGAKHMLERILARRYNIHIRKNSNGLAQPEYNKLMAARGSLDGSLATIDLKNASDSISIALCELVLPPLVFQNLMKIRSEYTKVGTEYHKLFMISTMGNGFTFPLMTLMFAALINALYKLEGVRPFNSINYGVFGDDLIVTTELAHKLIEALNSSGFTVNTEKSFLSGPFRESCGGDFYKGHEVRGIYLRKFNNEADVYSAFNRLHMWSIRNDISLYATLEYLKGLAKFQPVPGHASVHEGFIITSDHLTSPKRDRNGAIYYRSLSARPSSRRVGGFLTNHLGAYICALGGYIRNNKILLRPYKPMFRVVKLKTPCWDYLTYPGVFHRDLSRSWDVLLSTP